jgi:Domain of unknown function (DUF1841)
LFNPSSHDVRKFFCQTWAKFQANGVMTPLEIIAGDWIAEHPEYHADLADEAQAVARNYASGAGTTNPFLHLSMHLSISEQISIDQPPGIKAAYATLCHTKGNAHIAAHEVMECLGEILWTAQRNNLPPDSNAYIDCLKRRIGPNLPR